MKLTSIVFVFEGEGSLSSGVGELHGFGQIEAVEGVASLESDGTLMRVVDDVAVAVPRSRTSVQTHHVVIPRSHRA